MQGALFLKRVFMPIKEKINIKHTELLEDEQVSMQIREVLKQIECVEKRFDWETDSDMIDSLIYEHHALLSRYKHLLILARQMNLSVEPSLS